MSKDLKDFPAITSAVIGQRTYSINTSFEVYRRDAFRHRSIPAQRDSINLEGKTGEGTVNTEGLWRVSAFDWSYGAGQLYADRDGSVANRFYQSTGVDVFTTQFQAFLLNALKQTVALNWNAVQAISTGKYVYVREQFQVEFTTDWSSFTSVTLPGHSGASAINWVAADSHFVYVAAGDGLWALTPGVASGAGITQICTNDVEGVWAPGDGRVFASRGQTLYDVTPMLNSGPADISTGWVIYQHHDPNWVWTSLVLGEGAYYLSGRVEISNIVQTNVPVQVFQTSVNFPSSAAQAQSSMPQLNYAQPALSLPLGEICNGLYSYLNYIFVGTNLGARMCRTVSAADPSGPTGSLIAGPLLPNLLQPMGSNFGCTAFVGHGRFVYFVWSTYTDVQGLTAAGLGIMDLGTMVDTLEPAYASSYMIPQASWGSSDGYVFWVDWDPITNGPMISLQNNGIWVIDSANLVSSGWIDSGIVTYNIPDEKVIAQGQIKRDAVGKGSITMALQTDGGGYSAATPLSPTSTESLTPEVFTSGSYNPSGGPTGLFRGEEINVETVLNRDGTTHSAGPTLKRWTLKSFPAVVSGTQISAVVNLYQNPVSSDGTERAVMPYDDYLYLENLRLTQTPVFYHEGTLNGDQNTPANGYTAIVVITELDWLPWDEQYSSDYGFRGDLVVYMKTIVG